MLAVADSQLHSVEQTDRDRFCNFGGTTVQTTRPSDVGALVFVVGLFVLLFLTTALVPTH